MIEDVTAAPIHEGEPMAKKTAPKKRAKRTRTAASTKKLSRSAATRKSAKTRGPGKRYTAAEKAKILAAAKKEGLTGAQAAKRFGISALTFYRWRGPVRGRKKRGRPVGSKNLSGKVKVNVGAVRREVQAQVRRLLPQIIREEVAAALGISRR
jgi:transposase-like protein